MEFHLGYAVAIFMVGIWLGAAAITFILGAHITEEKQGEKHHE